MHCSWGVRERGDVKDNSCLSKQTGVVPSTELWKAYKKDVEWGQVP